MRLTNWAKVAKLKTGHSIKSEFQINNSNLSKVLNILYIFAESGSLKSET